MTKEEFLLKNNISLLGNFGIFFEDIKEVSVGVYAEDTVYMIKNLLSTHENIILERLAQLKKWIKDWK